MAELVEGQHSGILQGGTDVSDHEDVVKIKPTAQRDQSNEFSMKTAEWQSFQSGGNRRRRILSPAVEFPERIDSDGQYLVGHIVEIHILRVRKLH